MRANVTSIALSGTTNLAVLAPIKPGFVDGFESITYVERLRRLLAALHGGRVAGREAAPTKPVFPDSIGRFGIIQSFRYAIFPRPDGAGGPAAALIAPGRHLLSLNVSFDGGWETYMRVIYRDIGTLLDALFCNCTGYPGSRTSSYDAYCRWVREHELSGGLFYADSSMSPGDQRYLEQVERMQREARDPVAADQAIAGFALASAREQQQRALEAAKRDPQRVVAGALKSMKGFYRLSPFFPPNDDDEAGILIRFAQDVLQEFRQLDQAGRPEVLPPELKRVFADELHWFRTPRQEPLRQERLAFDPARLQAGIVSSYPDITHGCLALLRIEAAAAAAAFLAGCPVSAEGASAHKEVQRNIALTWHGLRALGVPPERLDLLPQEFVEGMEARAGTLGDLRSNHPDNWNRPLRNWPPDGAASNRGRIDLSTVHVVVVLRLADAGAPGSGLHPQLQAEVAALQAAGSGLAVLGVEPMRSWREAGSAMTRDHFGFLDGFSQPRPRELDATAQRARDDVKVGELLLGYGNDRGDGPCPEHADELLDDGTFLVIRKLRQHVDVLHGVLDKEPAPAALLERMVGRRMDGTPLVEPAIAAGGNDFDFGGDPSGARCPFHSHVRRTNPRDGRRMPRIVRRGMSYGPLVTGPADAGAERGLVFMGYCASIAEQFEVVQRWIAGGNSSGMSSSQADPLLGVPQPGEKRTFRFLQDDGTVGRVDLGERPFVSLEWGVYLFVPSLAALRKLPLIAAAASPANAGLGASAPNAAPADLSLDAWRHRLEDPGAGRNAAAWQSVREQEYGVLATHYGLLVGHAAGVLEVLKDDGKRFSVSGYGRRMSDSIGRGFLGLDPHTGHAEQAEGSGVNEAIESIDERQAFKLARPIVAAVLGVFQRLTLPEPGGAVKVPVDLLTLSESVLAQLCTAWFGLPDEELMVAGGRSSDRDAAPPRCPGHLFTTSRYIFAPRPSGTVDGDGKAQGKSVLEAFRRLLARDGPLRPLARAIVDRLQPLASGKGGDRDLVARTLAGVMLGFPPTVHGNFVRIIDTWLASRALWDLQQRLVERTAELPDAFARAEAVLLGPIIAAMRQRPVPDMIWRTAVGAATQGGKAPIDADKRVVLGLGSALADAGADPCLMFGGRRSGPHKTVHACPGYGMAIGVLLALLSGLLEAGQLRPTASSIQLTLMPPAS